MTVNHDSHYLLVCTVWETFRDIHGYKPNWNRFESMTDAELNAFLDELTELQKDISEQHQQNRIMRKLRKSLLPKLHREEQQFRIRCLTPSPAWTIGDILPISLS